jgi:L-2,4-diaminobutyric acid acetyltransferase
MGTLVMDVPTVEDGAAVWRLACDSGALDANSSYSYLLWFRDFARTSVVTRGAGGAPVGFVTGFRRPEQPDTLVVWQIAVERAHRGRGVAAAMLDHLTARLREKGSLRAVETTVGARNTASRSLFRSYAARHMAPLRHEPLFPRELFPDPHDAEHLLRIGPLSR